MTDSLDTTTRQLPTHVQLDVTNEFAGRVYAYVAVVGGEGGVLGVAEANVRGYTPISSFHYTADYPEAEAEAKRLNEAMDVTDMQAIEIVTSSMFGPVKS